MTTTKEPLEIEYHARSGIYAAHINGRKVRVRGSREGAERFLRYLDEHENKRGLLYMFDGKAEYR